MYSIIIYDTKNICDLILFVTLDFVSAEICDSILFLIIHGALLFMIFDYYSSILFIVQDYYGPILFIIQDYF